MKVWSLLNDTANFDPIQYSFLFIYHQYHHEF